MSRYSVLSLLKNAVSGHKGWDRAWRDPEPKPEYDVIIVGGGGHGLATAYYLAKLHGVTNVAVLEKGYLGGGNTGRNTTILRSNYLASGNTLFYEQSMRLWEGLSQDLNFNVMMSQRGQLNLGHSDAQMTVLKRRGNTMRLNGIDADILGLEQVRKIAPYFDYSPNARFPIYGALWQGRAGIARHDAVAWGYARGADGYGVDLIQNCEVTGFIKEGEKVVGVETTRGRIRAKKVGTAVAGHTGYLAAKAGLTLPLETHVLQAFVSEPLKPIVNIVVSCGAMHFYLSQSDKGTLVFGGDLDGYNTYAQRGNLPLIEHVMAAGVSLMPSLSRVRFHRHWGGVMDMTMDGSPIICKSPIPGLFINGGWCYGGFKATPASGWCFAHTIAQDRPHDLNAKFTIERFSTGHLIEEKGAGPYPWAQ
jgi:heterotetrameric sarcosine oxidase beta subunit